MEKISKKEWILRDHLAANRTVLANERTLLAYVRTALTFLVAGTTLIKFFDSGWAVVLGWFLDVVGFATFFAGLLSFRKMRQKLKNEKAQSPGI